ncbi:MAG: hypothetical protein E5V61_21825 [Mesorhizobium sp.]|nr:MAG: hypothetical protein E5V61_21825 [Mesorhizobium sp.]TIX64761.1 MAG: hypothetical protein E5V30_28545 [Mesorhizobium sp.]
MQESERQYTERLLREMLDDARAKEDARAEEARSATAKAARAMAAKVAVRTGAVLAKAAKPALPRTAGPARTVGDDLPKASQVEVAETIQASRDSLIDDLFSRTEWPTPPKAEFPRLGKKPDRRSDFVVAALGVTLGLICALFPWYIFFNQEQFGVQAIKFGGSGTNAGRVSGGSQMENPGQPLTAKDVPDVDLFATGTLQDPEDPATAPGVDQQPFPADPKFRMVHVANGRAMIEDDAGLWIVQRGSKLPDSSIVSSIEQRGGKWVMVTSTDQVIELSK